MFALLAGKSATRHQDGRLAQKDISSTGYSIVDAKSHDFVIKQNTADSHTHISLHLNYATTPQAFARNATDQRWAATPLPSSTSRAGKAKDHHHHPAQPTHRRRDRRSNEHRHHTLRHETSKAHYDQRRESESMSACHSRVRWLPWLPVPHESCGY